MTYPPDWPVCPNCGKPALDGHITCGSFACGEHRFRRQREDEYRANKIREQRKSFKVVAPPNDNGGPVTAYGVPIRHPDGRPVLAGDLIPGAAYELTEDGMLFSVEPRIDFDWCKNNGEKSDEG